MSGAAPQDARRPLNVLCAGAAQGFIKAMEPVFTAQTGASIVARFGAVGALREALLAGDPCDVLIVTDVMVHALISEGRLRADSRIALGQVRTGMAVREDHQQLPDVSTGASLRETLRAATGIHFPDPMRATAGVHFAEVMHRLGIHAEVADCCHTYANGATAMRALAESGGSDEIGCTQLSEIIFTPGLRVIGSLPPGFELATIYSSAVTQATEQPGLAQAFNALLGAAVNAAVRARCGIEPPTTAG